MLTTETIDWEAIYRMKFVDQSGCWTSGCNSYCCTHKSDHLAFSILTGGAGMIFFAKEFDFLLSAGKLQGGFEEKSRRMNFTLAPGIDLNFVISKCALNGICTIRDYRPLCCKIYPFLPRVDLRTSEITGFTSGTVFDLFWSVLGKEHPCTLVRTKPAEVQRQLLPPLQRLLEHPYFLFHFRAVELFLDHTAAGIENLRAIHPDLSSQALSKKWELLYLSGKAFDSGKVRGDILEAYQTVAQRFLGFEI